MSKHYKLTNSETMAPLQKNDKLKRQNSHSRSFTYKEASAWEKCYFSLNYPVNFGIIRKLLYIVLNLSM